MNPFVPPTQITTRDVALSSVILVALLLLAPESKLRDTIIPWSHSLLLFPVFLLCGLFSAWLFYGRHPRNEIDPFYIRAWWCLGSGLVALPVCLIFRPAAAHLAFLALVFGLGPVIGFHLYRRFTRRE